MAGKNAVWKWKQLGDLLVMCCTDGSLADEDIQPCFDLHKSDKVKRAICYAFGNATMSAAQRKRAAESMRDHPNYVVTSSAITRGVITAMSWLGQPMRACAPSEIREAIRTLGVPENFNEEDVLREIGVLKEEVSRLGVVSAAS